jgi:hypothetical protein
MEIWPARPLSGISGDMTPHVCGHLRALEDHLVGLRITIAHAGSPWSQNCRYWITFDTVLDLAALRTRLGLDACIEDHVNDDPRSGREQGLVCSIDHDGIIGRHPLDAAGRATVA